MRTQKVSCSIVHAAHERLQKLVVVFRAKPTRMGPVLTAVLEDTCGNLIQVAQK